MGADMSDDRTPAETATTWGPPGLVPPRPVRREDITPVVTPGSPVPSLQRPTRSLGAMIAATIVGALPGAWMLWRVLSIDPHPNQRVGDVPLLAQWVRGKPRSFGSVVTPQFFSSVMRTGLLVAATGMLVAFAAVACFITVLVVRRRPRWGLLVGLAIGAILVAIAPILVHSKDASAARAFASRSGSEYNQLVGSCWFSGYHGADATELGALRTQLTQTLADGTLVVACSYRNWTSWERGDFGIPGGHDFDSNLTAILADTDGHLNVLGAIDTPNGFPNAFTISDSQIHVDVHITGGPNFGTGDTHVQCDRPLQPDVVAEPCS